jgi:hypothetical protein
MRPQFSIAPEEYEIKVRDLTKFKQLDFGVPGIISTRFQNNSEPQKLYQNNWTQLQIILNR